MDATGDRNGMTGSGDRVVCRES